MAECLITIIFFFFFVILHLHMLMEINSSCMKIIVLSPITFPNLGDVDTKRDLPTHHFFVSLILTLTN